MADFVLESGQVLRNIHADGHCNGANCVIHNPSDHSLKDRPRSWRPERGIVERICAHGVGHPDPDQHLSGTDTMHSCDGCCVGIDPGEPDDEWDVIARVDRYFMCVNADCPIAVYQGTPGTQADCPLCETAGIYSPSDS